MNQDERRALARLKFNYAPTADDVWAEPKFHVDGLHGYVGQTIIDGVDEARRSDGSSPIGIAIQGRKGSGKTHLLGWVRQQVQEEAGYFFLVSLLDSQAFWQSTVLSIVDGFQRRRLGADNQLKILIRGLAALSNVSPAIEAAVTGKVRITPTLLDEYIKAVWHVDNSIGRDTLKALVLLASGEFDLYDIGYNYLLSDVDTGNRQEWAMQSGAKPAQLLVQEMSRLLAMTGPTVIAVDQIDALLAQTNKRTVSDESLQEVDGGPLPLHQIAGGLMTLREMTRRTLILVACIPASWQLIRTQAVDTVADRFHEALHLSTIPSPDIGRALVEKRFGVRFKDIGFHPQFPSWPVAKSAFADAPEFTPRGLLRCVDAHVQSCLQDGAVRMLTKLSQEIPVVSGAKKPSVPTASAEQLLSLDARFAAIRNGFNATPALDAQLEDQVMPGLLSAWLSALIDERSDGEQQLVQDPLPSAKPALHARLRRSIDENIDDEMHWALRAISTASAVAAIHRVKAASTVSGLYQGVGQRKLYLLRNTPWPTGPKITEVVRAFAEAGGETLPITIEDLKVFGALQEMLAGQDENMRAWLLSRKPASDTALYRYIFADELADANVQESVPAGENFSAASTSETVINEGPSLILGRAVPEGDSVAVTLEALRKHVAIFAGSGSGKTVFIRRLLEECALQGVSSIVLDPNNDLARLGDAWPEPPMQWGDGDAMKAADFLANTDVVVWTPRREGGRPLSFQPLPDFRGVLESRDEFNVAIDAAVATLAPRAKVDGDVNKAFLGRAVLHESLRFFARQGNNGLKHFISFLADLPDGVSSLDNSQKMAAAMAQTLTAAMVIDPLFGGEGEAVDPGVLLTPAAGKRARISVISFVGLPADDQRQSFVNQLQMALFAWIKDNPAGERPLGGLLVMDEAQTLAPSGAMTACTQSTLALASQARKYGLGLVFATQAPKGLHNRIPGNAATQLYGFLNSPTQIAAAKEMAQAKGGEVPDISRLTTGQFYAAGEGLAFQKLQTPLCLSHHPKSPLTTEEVIGRARGSD